MHGSHDQNNSESKLLHLTKKTFTLHKTQHVKAHAEHLVDGDRKCSAMKIQPVLTSNCIRHILTKVVNQMFGIVNF